MMIDLDMMLLMKCLCSACLGVELGLGCTVEDWT